MPQPLCDAIHAKIHEQIERIEHLILLVPPESMEWAPPIDQPWTIQQLLEHLVGCLAGFCAVLYAMRPEQLAHFQELRKLDPVAQPNRDQILNRLHLFSGKIVEGFDQLEDCVLSQVLPTVFVPEGESGMTLLLGNLEHLINHKYQLFTDLRLMGLKVNSSDLYRFRG